MLMVLHGTGEGQAGQQLEVSVIPATEDSPGAILPLAWLSNSYLVNLCTQACSGSFYEAATVF